MPGGVRIAGLSALLVLLTGCDLLQKTLSPAVTGTSSCQTPLSAEIKMIAPFWGPPKQEMDVVWQVIASGCTGKFRIQEHPEAGSFDSFGHFFRYYVPSRPTRERVTVQSIDGAGNVLDELPIASDPFPVTAEEERFLSPPAEVRIEGQFAPNESLSCRLDRITKLGPTDTAVRYRFTATGRFEGATVNGYAVKNGQEFSVSSAENQVFRVIGVAFGHSGHTVCTSSFVAPRCQISLLENSFDLVRKKILLLGRVDRVTVDGNSKNVPQGAESITFDEVPNRVAHETSKVLVVGPEGDQGSCEATYDIPPPEIKIQPLRAVASSNRKEAVAGKAIDGTTQEGWVSQTKGSGWIRVDLGRNFRLSKIRLCIDQYKPGKTRHEILAGKVENQLRPIASIDELTSAGQWLEKKFDERDVRYVEVRTLKTNSPASWREIEFYQCTTFRKCTSKSDEIN